MIDEKIVTIDGVEYVRKDMANTKADDLGGMPYVIIRTYSAGVFAGYLESRKGKEVKLKKARRLYYWKGAATLSQLAMEGVKNSNDCKFPCEVDIIILTEAIEVIETTEKCKKSIDEVKIWQI